MSIEFILINENSVMYDLDRKTIYLQIFSLSSHSIRWIAPAVWVRIQAAFPQDHTPSMTLREIRVRYVGITAGSNDNPIDLLRESVAVGMHCRTGQN